MFHCGSFLISFDVINITPLNTEVNSYFWWCGKESNFLFGLMRPKSAPSCHTKLAKVEGIEPSTRGFGDRRSTTELHRHWRCVAELNRVLSCLGFAIPPLTVRATHRIKKPSEIFIWEGSLIRYISDIRYIEPPRMRIYSPPQSGVINQF